MGPFVSTSDKKFNFTSVLQYMVSCNRRDPVASQGLMSPGAATDGVTLFFLGKTDLFSHRPPESDSCRLLTTPTIFPRRLSSVRSKFSHKN